MSLLTSLQLLRTERRRYITCPLMAHDLLQQEICTEQSLHRVAPTTRAFLPFVLAPGLHGYETTAHRAISQLSNRRRMRANRFSFLSLVGILSGGGGRLGNSTPGRSHVVFIPTLGERDTNPHPYTRPSVGEELGTFQPELHHSREHGSKQIHGHMNIYGRSGRHSHLRLYRCTLSDPHSKGRENKYKKNTCRASVKN